MLWLQNYIEEDKTETTIFLTSWLNKYWNHSGIDLEAFCIPCHLYAAFCFVLNDTHGTELGLGPVRVLYIVVTPVWHESTDVDVRLLCNAVVEPSLDHVAGDKTRVTFVILTLIPWFLLVLLTFPVPLPCVKKLSIHCFSVR